MIGLNLKYLTHSYNLDSRTKSMNDPVFAQTSSGGFTPDVGILVKPYRLSIGVSVLNILQPDVGLKTSDKVPMVIKSGIAYQLGGWGIIDSLTPTVDISSRKPEGGTSDTKVSFGMELWIRKTLALRIGGNDREVTAGCSYSKAFSESDIQFDYAFLSPTELTEASGSHRISISFGMSVPERKKLDSTRAAIIPVKETEVTVETIKEKYLKRGYQHFERAEYSDAISAWEEVLKVDPGNSEVKNKIKMAKMWLGQETSSGADSEQIAGAEFAREQLNINTANEIELIDVGFTREEARNIIAYRKKSKFKKIDDLSSVPGMTPEKFNKIKLKLKIR